MHGIGCVAVQLGDWFVSTFNQKIGFTLPIEANATVQPAPSAAEMTQRSTVADNSNTTSNATTTTTTTTRTRGSKLLGWRGLCTHHDVWHIHKTLGILCLLHFVYRFASALPRYGHDLGFSLMLMPSPSHHLQPRPWTDAAVAVLGTVVLHGCLSLSSLAFRIPRRRIASSTRIWPQFRAHSIIFALRSLACLVLVWLRVQAGCDVFVLFCVCEQDSHHTSSASRLVSRLLPRHCWRQHCGLGMVSCCSSCTAQSCSLPWLLLIA